MADPCTCLNCQLAQFFQERFPDGLTPEESTASLNALAAVAGWILASGGEASLQGFVSLLVAERQSYRKAERPSGGGLH